MAGHIRRNQVQVLNRKQSSCLFENVLLEHGVLLLRAVRFYSKSVAAPKAFPTQQLCRFTVNEVISQASLIGNILILLEVKSHASRTLYASDCFYQVLDMLDFLYSIHQSETKFPEARLRVLLFCIAAVVLTLITASDALLKEVQH